MPLTAPLPSNPVPSSYYSFSRELLKLAQKRKEEQSQPTPQPRKDAAAHTPDLQRPDPGRNQPPNPARTQPDLRSPSYPLLALCPRTRERFSPCFPLRFLRAPSRPLRVL